MFCCTVHANFHSWWLYASYTTILCKWCRQTSTRCIKFAKVWLEHGNENELKQHTIAHSTLNTAQQRRQHQHQNDSAHTALVRLVRINACVAWSCWCAHGKVKTKVKTRTKYHSNHFVVSVCMCGMCICVPLRVYCIYETDDASSHSFVGWFIYSFIHSVCMHVCIHRTVLYALKNVQAHVWWHGLTFHSSFSHK